MTAGYPVIAPLLFALDNVRFIGPDGLILATSAAVVAITWRSVRTAHSDAGAKPDSDLVSVPAQRRSVFGYGLGGAGALAIPTRATSAGLLLVGLLIAWAGLRLLAQPDAVRIGLFLAVLGIVVVAWLDGQATRAGVVAVSVTGEGAGECRGREGFWEVVLPTATGNLRWLLTGLPIVCTLLVWRLMLTRPLADDHSDIVLLWMVAICGSAGAVAWPISRPDWLSRRRLRAGRGWALVVAAVALLAAVLRLWRPDHFPWIFSGDEGLFGLSAREVLNGEVSNPFGTGIQAHPNAFFYLQAASLRLFGDDVAGLRILSGLLGIAAVVALMFYARRMLGWFEAVVAGTVMATFHHHVFVSRTAMNNVGDTLFLPLALWLIDRGILGRRRFDSLLAGFVIGGAQYFYVGSRLLPVIAFVFVGAGMLFNWHRLPGRLIDRAREFAPYALLTIVGALVVVAPFLAFYLDHPELANARVRMVSIFSSGWLDREIESTGRSAASIIAHRIWDCLLLPFHESVQGFYRPEAPFVGAVLVVPVALGLGMTIAGFRERRYAGLAIAYVAASASLALTEGGVYQSNRYSGGIAICCLLAAIGIGGLTKILTRLVRINGTLVLLAAAVAVGVIGAWNVDFYFRDDNQVALYSDPNTQVANTLAYELKAMGAGTTVYFAGPPRMWYDGFANIEFIAPEAIGITIEEPLSAADQPPEITGTTLFVFLPERIDELDIVRGWFPGGDFREVHDEDDLVLYYEYRVGSSEPAGVYGN